MRSKKSKKSQTGGNNQTIFTSTLLGIAIIGGFWGIISYFKNSDSNTTPRTLTMPFDKDIEVTTGHLDRFKLKELEDIRSSVLENMNTNTR